MYLLHRHPANKKIPNFFLKLRLKYIMATDKKYVKIYCHNGFFQHKTIFKLK